FFADLIFSNGVEVSARPSDSIALALRTGATIFASEDVLEEAGVAIPDEQEDEVEKFREFLDTISPADFGRAGGRHRPCPAGVRRPVPGHRTPTVSSPRLHALANGPPDRCAVRRCSPGGGGWPEPPPPAPLRAPKARPRGGARRRAAAGARRRARAR